MARFKISIEESFFIVIMLFLGIFLSSARVILYLDSLSPLKGLLVYYVILYVSLFSLMKLGLFSSKFDIKKPLQILGTLLITFAFFMLINFESPYVNEVTGRHNADISPILYQSEDGAVWYLWSSVTQDITALRWLTFVITPVFLSFLGVLLVSKKVDI